MGTDEEPSRSASVDTEKWHGQWHSTGCARCIKAPLAIHADHGPGVAVRSCLRKNLATLLRAPGPIRRRVCAGLVQADAPRHGTDPALPWPAGSEGAPDM